MFSTYWPGWGPGDPGTCRHVFKYRGTCAHNHAGADTHSGNHDCTDTEQSSCTDKYISAQTAARPHMHSVFDNAIMINAGAGVNDHVCTNAGIGVDHAAGENHTAGSDAGATPTGCRRVNRLCQGESVFEQPVRHAHPGQVIADGDNA